MGYAKYTLLQIQGCALTLLCLATTPHPMASANPADRNQHFKRDSLQSHVFDPAKRGHTYWSHKSHCLGTAQQAAHFINKNANEGSLNNKRMHMTQHS